LGEVNDSQALKLELGGDFHSLTDDLAAALEVEPLLLNQRQ
jgi:hypothetical protein